MRWRPPVLLIFACALFLRAWVPAGWMPAAHGAAFAIEPCPGASARVDGDHAAHSHGKHRPGSHAGADGDCSFAPLSAAAAHQSAPPALPTEITLTEAPHQPAPLPFFATGPPSLPPPATGPPALT